MSWGIFVICLLAAVVLIVSGWILRVVLGCLVLVALLVDRLIQKLRG